MKYFLDTDTIIYFLKGFDSVVSKIRSVSDAELSTTIVNQTELLFGAFNSERKKQNLDKIESFLSCIKVVPFCNEASYIFAEQKAKLKRQGKILADLDLMIASIALRHKSILVTNNLRHFERIAHLKIESWYIN